jgi:hypothetical protein
MFDVLFARRFVAPKKRTLPAVLTLMLLAGCGAPPEEAASAPRQPPPAAAPTSNPSVPPPTVEPTRAPTPTGTATTVQAPVSTQTAAAQELGQAQQTAVAAQQTAAAQQAVATAQQGQLQVLINNQTVTAQQIGVVQQQAAASQQTAVAAQQGVAALQTTVANLLGEQATAVATRNVPPPTETPAPPTPTPATIYPWYWKRPTETPQMCGPGFGNPCLDSAPNEGTQYVSGHVIDPRGQPVAGITVQAKNGDTVYFNSTDPAGYYSIPLYTNCPRGPASWDVYIVDVNQRLSSYVKTITYGNCAQAGEFHVDFVQVAK